VEKRIRDATKVDKAKTEFGSISKFGLLELTRQRLRPSIETGNYTPCPHCQGRGLVKTSESASLAFLRQATHIMSKGGIGEIRARLNPDVAHYLANYKRQELTHLEERHRTRILITGDPSLPPGQWEMESFKRIQETDTVKPGQVANNLYDEELGQEGLSAYENEPHSNAQYCYGKTSHSNGSVPQNGHSNNHDSKTRGRRSPKRGRYDYSKNSDTHSSRESSFAL
jgi:ribonuclease E